MLPHLSKLMASLPLSRGVVHSLALLALVAQPSTGLQHKMAPAPLIRAAGLRPFVHVPRAHASRAHVALMAPLIAPTDHWAVWAAIAACAAVGQQLEGTRVGNTLSGPVCAMALAAALTNGGVLPEPTAQFRLGQAAVVRLCTPLLLLSADLRVVLSSTGRLLPPFLAGTLGTVLGALLGTALLAPQLAALPGGFACAAALAAKNVGSGLNFIAVSQALEVPAATVTAALSVDNIGALLYFPLLSILGARAPPEAAQADKLATAAPELPATAPAEPQPAAGSLQLAGSALALSLLICSAADRLGPPAATLPIVTALSVTLATCCASALSPILPSAQSLGSLLLYLFFATAGASGGVAPAVCAPLALLTLTVYAVHLAFVLACGRLGGWPLKNVLVSSSANIGGPATASSLAASRGWQSLVTPAILVGTLGNCVATFVGIALHSVMVSIWGT